MLLVQVKDKKEAASPLERILLDAEAEFGVRLTVHDVSGAFADRDGRPLLPRERQSHQRYPACLSGFGQRCLDHCRYRLNADLARGRAPAAHTCWKGLYELTVPLLSQGHYLGMLFVGTWRAAAEPPPRSQTGLPARWRAHFDALPPKPPAARLERLTRLFTALADGLVGQLVRLHRQPAGDVTRKTEITEFLRRESTRPVGLEDLARQLSLSPSRTSHLVAQLFGRPFRALLAEQRIQRAKVLLIGTAYPVAEIATRTGFNDEFYFSRAFKKHTGVSPLAFRKNPRDY